MDNVKQKARAIAKEIRTALKDAENGRSGPVYGYCSHGAKVRIYQVRVKGIHVQGHDLHNGRWITITGYSH